MDADLDGFGARALLCVNHIGAHFIQYHGGVVERGCDMGINQDALLTIKAQLSDRIDRIAEQIGHMPAGRLTHEIDDIRRMARDYGFQAVADLAHALESAMAQSEGSVTVLPYLDSMRDAVGCDALDDSTGASFLAVVNQRLYG